MIVRRDDGSTCQVSHRDWVAVDTLRQSAVAEAWRVIDEMHPDSASVVRVAARHAVGEATDVELDTARDMARAVARDQAGDRDWQIALVAVAAVARDSGWAAGEARRLVLGLRLALAVEGGR